MNKKYKHLFIHNLMKNRLNKKKILNKSSNNKIYNKNNKLYKNKIFIKNRIIRNKKNKNKTKIISNNRFNNYNKIKKNKTNKYMLIKRHNLMFMKNKIKNN